ncbi:uncharacterized protein si:dkey-229e3.2 isoform X2 [Oncorhynchus tshawytscha]|uniref:uncharacterized protein si:dkey-229e3.2 isoform X2 n=1 Tax=Oncorhynchus tshawytscha TaxID=74940 RepID=UPI000D0A221C|nr:uncharacterized protein si:dkey-229e3.2 isoform X2 [Oncorhynchus tshawytscha]XP_042185929.1 uncharacterized protein si:dkey-229e3.2 isoform X2 [Oncorhynchus tshawytscha]XP_042185930.1 uncharacterized protein si:dkey-229e3.2 isoform X2 [Oncorhynchus tshawytscha]
MTPRWTVRLETGVLPVMATSRMQLKDLHLCLHPWTWTSLNSQQSDCGSLWSHLVAEPSRLRLSEPKPSLHCHSHSRMVSALRITPSNCISDQWESVFLEDHEETTETSCPPAAALIKTKLLAPSSCHGDTPAFLYQISQQWLTQCSIQLQPQHHKKPPALNYGEG